MFYSHIPWWPLPLELCMTHTTLTAQALAQGYVRHYVSISLFDLPFWNNAKSASRSWGKRKNRHLDWKRTFNKRVVSDKQSRICNNASRTKHGTSSALHSRHWIFVRQEFVSLHIHRFCPNLARYKDRGLPLLYNSKRDQFLWSPHIRLWLWSHISHSKESRLYQRKETRPGAFPVPSATRYQSIAFAAGSSQ